MHTLTRALLCAIGVAALSLAGCSTTGHAHNHDHEGECCGECSGEGGSCCGECSGEGGSCCGTCGGGEAAATLSSNETCPFSGNAVDSGARTVNFNGQEVGFCCGGCADQFEQMTDEERAAKVASMQG